MKVVRYDFPDWRREYISLQELADNLPIWAGNTALNFFLDSWRRQGWLDERLERWKPRKEQDGRTGRRGILIGKGSGRLRRSLRMRSGPDYFEVYTNNPYAKIHNEGGRITQRPTARQRRFFWAMHAKAKKSGTKEEARKWKAMALADQIRIDIPRRQFMGDSRLLQRRIALHVKRGVQQAHKHRRQI